MTDFKTYIITLKDSLSESQVGSFKENVSKLGGSITSELSLINGFVATLPKKHEAFVQEHEHVLNIEEDKEVKIQ